MFSGCCDKTENVKKFLDDNRISIFSKMRKVIDDYLILYISEICDITKFTQIEENIQNSKVVVIYCCQGSESETETKSKSENLHYILCIEKTIIVIKQNDLTFFEQLLSINEKIEFCFLANSKTIFDQNKKINYKTTKLSKTFNTELRAFNKEFKSEFNQESYKPIWTRIQYCISGYLLQKSHLIHEDKLSNNNYNIEKVEIKTFYEDDYIELCPIGYGSLFLVNLIYNYEDGQLYALKRPYRINKNISKLQTREIDNYKNINYLFFPKFYGTTDKKEYLVFEYINGQILEETDLSNFSISDKLTIILQILFALCYLHINHFIYRDLKPDNIMIKDKKVFIIDFDRIVCSNQDNKVSTDNDDHTNDFNSVYIAPEVNLGLYTNQSDVYSIGKIMKYVFKGIDEYPQINRTIEECLNDNQDQRPDIIIIIAIVYILMTKIDQESTNYQYQYLNYVIHNIPGILFTIGFIYSQGDYFPKDIDKAIHYFKLAETDKDPEVQYSLGRVYYENKIIPQDIDKAIHWFTLAANHKHPDAQFELGLIYYENKYVPQDIKKAMHYFELAEKSNDRKILSNLGVIYYMGSYIKRDIDKAIRLMTLSANQNYPEAQFNLGKIFYESNFIPHDIDKSIYYLTLAAKQNHLRAQYKLGLIYYAKKDTDKAIHYLKIAADRNYSSAQYCLGVIYYEFKQVVQDIDKAIQYLKSSVERKNANAQYLLGIIYFEGKHIQKDIKQAIEYFKLAANQNHSGAQFNLGCILYHDDKYKNINEAIAWVIKSADKWNIEACHFIGFLYQEGKNIEKDIQQSIHYYREASSFNLCHSKNNLGMIYKHGIDGEIEKNPATAEIYFQEAIEQSDDPVLMYNLAHLYIYDLPSEESINKSINLLIKSTNHGLVDSFMLLMSVLCKKNNGNYERICDELSGIMDQINSCKEARIEFKINKSLKQLFIWLLLYPILETNFDELYKDIDFIYDQSKNIIKWKDIFHQENDQNSEIEDKKENGDKNIVENLMKLISNMNNSKDL